MAPGVPENVCSTSPVPTMTRGSTPQRASHTYRPTVLLWLLSGSVNGFLVGAPRTVLPTTNHVGSGVPAAVPATRCNAAALVAGDVVPEEVILMSMIFQACVRVSTLNVPSERLLEDVAYTPWLNCTLSF